MVCDPMVRKESRVIAKIPGMNNPALRRCADLIPAIKRCQEMQRWN
jgi:hypothetical protein